MGDQRELEARREAAALKRAIEVQKFRELRLFEVTLLAEETMMSCTELRELQAEVALCVTDLRVLETQRDRATKQCSEEEWPDSES